MNYIEAILEASIVNKLVFVALLVLSISTWVVILQKFRLLRKTLTDTSQFLSTFRNSAGFLK